MKKWIKSVEFAAVILLILVFVLVIAKNPSITGFVTTEIYTQKLNIEVRESSLLAIEPISAKQLRLNSLMLSGKVIGDGLAEIYLTDGHSKRLVYTNLQKKKNGLTKITGRATGSVRVYEKAQLRGEVMRPNGYETAQEAFDQACAETCFLDNDLPRYYGLEVWVQPGTIVKISELKYSVIE